MKPDDERYFERIETRLDEAFERAEAAKSQGRDPEPEIEIPVARDMADRVENILGIDGVAERVRELEGEMSREEAALALVTDFVEGSVGDFDSRAGKVEGAVRTAVALLTEGVVAAPIEGIDRVELLGNDDGTEFINVYYAGPIRSAGGTAQALSVLVADYARSLLGIEEFHARSEEVERYAEEVALYDKETGLQYTPKAKETKFIARHMPIMLDGEATGDEEVSGFRDLDRVDTNATRGGMCLVLAEGIALKAPKIQRYTRELDEVDWPWLQDLIDGTIGTEDSGEGDGGDADEAADDDADEAADADDGVDEAADVDEGSDAVPEDRAGVDAHDDGPPRPDPSEKFLRDLIAGRPVFTHPSEPGGFRLRYGRARNHGFATGGIHPATMHVVDDFLAAGTQIKTERPGKAHGVVPVDSIEGPTVRLANGDVRRIDDPAEALEVRNGVEEILDLGEYLVNYGEFVENNHPLAPASYTVEWWVQEFDAAGADVQALRDDPRVDLAEPTVEEALAWAREYDCPLHPAYTYLWHDLDVETFETLATAVADGELVEESSLLVERTETTRRALEVLLVEHTQTDETLRIPTWRPLARSLGVDDDLCRTWEPTELGPAREYAGGENAVAAVNAVAPFTVRERAPTRIGNRMGRPEKSESRDLSPAVHTLFPITEAGGNQRDIAKAAKTLDDRGRRGMLELEINDRVCPDCDEHTYHNRCPDCRVHTDLYYECGECGTECEPDESGRVVCPRCEWEVRGAARREVDLNERFHDALESVAEREAAFDVLKGVKGLSSANKVPEAIEKGVLRAKHGVSSFKDGTVRYDMTDLPVTAVRPAELDVTVDQFRELGYHADIDGEPLRHDDQLVELKVQDVVLSDGAAEHMMKTASFVDELLEDFYGLPPFYELDDRDDLVGELVFGMAPHTSAATVGRVVGFTSAAVGYAHPYFHAAKRRNCFHPETKLWYRDDDGWHHDSIEQLVESSLVDPETDDFGTLVQELDQEIYVPSIDDGGNDTLRSIEAVSKHVATDHLIEIETKSGRQLRVTPDHSMLRWDGSPERVDAKTISEGDHLPMPKSVPSRDETVRFDLLEEFLHIDCVPNEELMIRGIGPERLKALLEGATPGDGYLTPTAEFLNRSNSSVYNWISRDSIPASVLLDLFGDVESLLGAVPDDVRLGIRRDTATLNRWLTIDEKFGRLLGYYAAEGFTRKQDGSFYQTTICIPDERPRRQISSIFDERLGVDTFEENKWKVTVSSRLVAVLFDDVLDLGANAHSKQIPDAIVSGSNPVLREFLSAYFDGDGSASTGRIEVRAHTVSDELKTDLEACLKRFGIAAKTFGTTRTPETGAVAEFYEGEPPSFDTWILKITSKNAVRFHDRIGFNLERKAETLAAAIDSVETRTPRLLGDGGEVWIDEVTSVGIVESDVEYTYSLTVADTHTLVANDLYTAQCDGDEDCVMLLMDGLLNFSRQYLPDKRGGSMDAPLVMSSRIDPSEIDDEAHNMDIVREYPLEFYEATRRMADPGEVEELIQLGEDTLGTDEEYRGFDHTHDTTDIAMGPDLSAYKTLGSMMDKMDAQLALARKLRAVDETDVAERVIEYHFLPDLIGNLRAFARQETRCLDCETKYRRMPLSGECRNCGGNVNLTVHQGSVNKYMDVAIEIAEQFGCREYTKQRLEILDRSLESVFEDDTNKQSGIADFM